MLRRKRLVRVRGILEWEGCLKRMKFGPQTPPTKKGVDLPRETQRDRDRPKTRFLDISLPHPGALPPRKPP